MQVWRWIAVIAIAAVLAVGIGLGTRHWRVAPLPARTFHWFEKSSSPPSYVPLPQSAMTDWSTHLFSTGALKPVAHYWRPDQGQLDELEIYLTEISLMHPRYWDWSPTVQDPSSYNLQFLGVELGGKKQILVNAACHLDDDDEDATQWNSRLYIVSDGFICYWHAFYTPDTQSFSDLTINGRA